MNLAGVARCLPRAAPSRRSLLARRAPGWPDTRRAAMACRAIDGRLLGAARPSDVLHLREQVVVDGTDHLPHLARRLLVPAVALRPVVAVVAVEAPDAETAAEAEV